MKKIAFLMFVVASAWIWACDDTNTSPPNTAASAGSGSSSQQQSQPPSESRPRQFSP